MLRIAYYGPYATVKSFSFEFCDTLCLPVDRDSAPSSPWSSDTAFRKSRRLARGTMGEEDEDGRGAWNERP